MVLEVTRSQQGLCRSAAGSCGGRRDWSRPSTVSISGYLPERRWAWSAKAARASRRWPAWSCGSSTPTEGRIVVDGKDISTLRGPHAPPPPRRDAARVPGSLLVARPAAEHRRHRGGAPGHPYLHEPVRAGAARGRAPRAGRPGLARAATPASRVLRRAAPAHRHRPRPRPAAEAAGVRRAGQRAGRLHAVAGDQPAQRSAAGTGDRLSLHRARPLGGPSHQQPHRRDVPRPDRRGGRCRRGVRTPDPPLYLGPALGHSRPGSGPPVRAQTDHPPRRGERGLRVGEVGCRFRARCPFAMDVCAQVDPEPYVTPAGTTVRCHLHTSGPTLGGATVARMPEPSR